MSALRIFVLALTVGFFMTSMGEAQVKPPVAKEIPTTLEIRGDKRIDNYYWLKERENPDVISYLNQENEYTNHVMEDTKELQDQLFEETKARIKQDDTSVPYSDRGYVYYTRYEEGKQYPIHCRRVDEENSPEEIMINVNELAKGKPFCNVRGLAVSSENNLLAFAVDFVGRRKYDLKFKDLTTGEILEDEIPVVTGNIVWAEDNKTIFYTKQDPVTLRSYQVYKHTMGDDAENDELVYEETDEEFRCGVFKTRSRDYIVIGSSQTLADEYRFIPSDQPDKEFQVFLPRKENHEHSIDHLDGYFFIRTNDDAENFRLMKVRDSNVDRENWVEVIPHNKDIYFQGYDLFTYYLVVEQRNQGLVEIIYRKWNDEEFTKLKFNDPAYVAGSRPTPDPETSWLRYSYTSMTTPNSTYEFNMDSGEQKLLKQTEVLGDFDSANYKSERVWATARDGVKVPVSIVYHKDTKIDGTAPCLEYGYGSYGASMDPRFNSTTLNLLDRGFVYAIAHIRGGQEMGRQWYEDGKLFKKINTFTDFIDVGKFLVENKYADPNRLYARGGSAGGLLMGAVINLAPELYHGVIADVPFVDVVTTMLDDSIPLTTSEYDEWGNPNKEDYYEYMLSYSPYDNVSAVSYPNLLVTTGLHDSQVQYWEPAKWVAKMRKEKSGDNILILKTNMDAGHGGASGRFDRFKEVAFRHAFLLKLAEIEE